MPEPYKVSKSRNNNRAAARLSQPNTRVQWSDRVLPYKLVLILARGFRFEDNPFPESGRIPPDFRTFF